MKHLRVFCLSALLVPTLFACGNADTELDESPQEAPELPDKSDVAGADGKGDSTVDFCAIYDLSPNCDICEEAAWYNDGVCDEFCSESDVDCFEFAPATEPVVLSCGTGRDNFVGFRIADVDENGDVIEAAWADGETRDLFVNGSNQAGLHEDACVMNASANEVVCEFGTFNGRELRIVLDVQRSEVCDTMWERTDYTMSLSGTYNPGAFSRTRDVTCTLADYPKHTPC